MKQRAIPADIRSDIEIAGLSLTQLIIVISLLMASSFLLLAVANFTNLNVITLGIVLFIFILLTYLSFLFSLRQLLINTLRYKKSKKNKYLGDYFYYTDLGAITVNEEKNDVVFLEHTPMPFETLTSDERDSAAEEWVNQLHHIVDNGGIVTNFTSTTKESKEHLERRYAQLETLSGSMKAVEEKRIDYHYEISEKATDTKYIQKIERLSSSDEDLDELIVLPGEVIDGDLVSNYSEEHLLPSYKKSRGEQTEIEAKNKKYKVNVDLHPKHVKLDDHYITSLVITEFPKLAKVNMLYDFTHDSRFVGVKKGKRSDIKITTFIKKSDLVFGSKQKTKMDRIQSSIEKKKHSRFESEVANPHEVATLEGLKQVREGGELFEVTMVVALVSNDKRTFDRNLKALKKSLRSKGFRFDNLFLRQSDALSSNWYLGNDSFLKKHPGMILPASSLAALYPFHDGTLSDENGTYEGHRTKNSKASYESFGSSGNENIIVIGPSGSGKSFKIQSKVESLLKVGERVYIFDIDGEYYDICVENKGNYIDLTGDDAVYADPTKIETPLMDELNTKGLKQTEIDKAVFSDAKRYKESTKNTIATIRLLCRTWDGSNKMKNASAKAITNMYEAAGIFKDQPETWNNNPEKVSIHILYHDYICKMAMDTESKYYEGANELQSQLETYFEGIDDHILKNAVDSSWLKDNPLTVFKIGEQNGTKEDDEMAALRINLISPLIDAQVKRDRLKKEIESTIVYDEYQRVRKLEAANQRVYRDITTGRKFNLKVILGFNDPSFLFPNHGAIWTNTKHKWFFKIDQKTIDDLSKAADMSDEIKNTWKNLGEYEYIQNKKIKGKDYYDTLKVMLPKSETKRYETRSLDRSA